VNEAIEPLQAFGEFPPTLYRVFDDERWARAFVEEGRMRFRLVQVYQRHEDEIRADASEGNAHLLVSGDVTTLHFDEQLQIVGRSKAPGFINYQGTFLNPVYVYCFTYPPDGRVDLLPSRFGRYVVKIDEPQRLAQEITNWLTVEGILRGTPVVECAAVRYNKGEQSEEITDHLERTRLNYCQKPKSFADEFEYRYAVVASPPSGQPVLDDHDIILGRPLPYVTLLSL
jgi:hypothetical protein